MAGLSALWVMLFMVCTSERNNPLDAYNPNFVPPSIYIDTTGTNIGKGDTISIDSATITVTGNRTESRFRARIDSGVWSQWQVSGVFGYDSLTSGRHSVTIGSKYGDFDVVVTDTITFFVRPNVFTVSYLGNNNTSGSVPTDANAYEQGANVTVKANTGNLVRTGYTFAGWNTAANGSGTDYAGSAILIMGTAGVSLYAKWTQNPTFTVIYNGNNNTSGSVPTDANAYEQGANVTVKANTGNLVRTGYTFTGWNTADAGTGNSYAGGESFTIGTAGVTLYAKWTQNPTFTVTYNGNNSTSGSVPTDANSYEQGASARVQDNTGTLQKTGYTFASWNSLQNGSGKSYAPNDTLTMGGANITIWAKWVIDTFTVKFDSKGGSAVDSQRVIYNAVAVEPAIIPVKAGYVFAGWYAGSSLSGSSFDFATPITASRTLYAKWNPVYTVTYDANGGAGTVPVDTNKYQNGSIVIVMSGSALSRNNYTFGGWNTQADTLGANYSAGGTFAMGSANVNLYAKWRMKSPVITSHPINKSCPVNDTVTFAIVAAGASLSYQWQKNNVDISGATAASYTPPALTVDDTAGSATYRCVVSNSEGTATSNSATLAISTLTDCDGNVYHQVKIGNQIWTMENLRVTKYNDGTTAIPMDTSTITWADATTPKYCYYNNTTNADSIKKFGALYNWYVVNSANGNKIAPVGWHVPSDAEWDTLENYLIVNGYNWDNTTTDNKIAKSMAAKTDWLSSTVLGSIGNNLVINNSSGFSALPGGYRDDDGKFNNQIYWREGRWWTSNASCCFLTYDNQSLGSITPDWKSTGSSVRLVRD
jgi:uncharacterized protein (TIGR02145 family)/uncharacterized repeat protein (TIGR02543 family)